MLWASWVQTPPPPPSHFTSVFCLFFYYYFWSVKPFFFFFWFSPEYYKESTKCSTVTHYYFTNYDNNKPSLVSMHAQPFYLEDKIQSLYKWSIKSSGGPLSALTCCVNVRLLSAIKKISPLIYSQSWVGSWVYTTQAMMTFTLIF